MKMVRKLCHNDQSARIGKMFIQKSVSTRYKIIKLFNYLIILKNYLSIIII